VNLKDAADEALQVLVDTMRAGNEAPAIASVILDLHNQEQQQQFYEKVERARSRGVSLGELGEQKHARDVQVAKLTSLVIAQNGLRKHIAANEKKYQEREQEIATLDAQIAELEEQL
jgi:hypothetical protein